MKDYALFIPPKELATKKAREWTSIEAKDYFKWFISVKEIRVKYLLTTIDEQLTNDPDEDIKRIGSKVTLLLQHTPFSMSNGVEEVLTNEGHALAADMGLLISKLVIENYPQIKWGIVKRPTRDISFHLPALFGFLMIDHIELIGPSIVHAKEIISGETANQIWYEMFSKVVEAIEPDTGSNSYSLP